MRHLIKQKLEEHPALKWRFQLLKSGGVSRLISSAKSYNKSEVSSGKKFIFIVGSGRCGSTLLRRILMEQSDIFIPPETYVLASAYLDTLKASKSSWPDIVDCFLSRFEAHPEFPTFGLNSLENVRNSASTWQDSEQSISRLVEELYCQFATAVGINATWFGDKTPSYVFQLGVVRSMMSQAKYIYLLRDGVDVAVSCKECGRYDSLDKGAYRWIKSQHHWAAFKKRLTAEEYLEIRYEDMVMDMQSTLTEIVEKFNIPLREEVIDTSTRLGDVDMRSHHSNVLLPVTSAFISKGRETLGCAERRRVGRILNRHLVDAGYDTLS